MELHKIPKHIAMIPDGNRRWARKRGLKPWLGHDKGMSTIVELLEASIQAGVIYTTFWATSVDNLTKRDKLEVKFLLEILERELSKKTLHDFLHKNKVRVNVWGEWENVLESGGLKKALRKLKADTREYGDYTLSILLAYDGKREMLDAIEKTANSGSPVSGDILRQNLWTGELPDVDLVIRTSGQPHWSSGFMMWLTANSEFYFTEMLWPDFNAEELQKALLEYEKRSRNLGK